MASNARFALAAAAALLAACGCVSVKGEKTLVPPTGLYAHFRAPITVNREPVPCENLKSGTGSSAVYLKEWVYTGLSADICDMALREAVEDGKLKKVYFADYEQQTFLGFVTLFKVTAYGE